MVTLCPLATVSELMRTTRGLGLRTSISSSAIASSPFPVAVIFTFPMPVLTLVFTGNRMILSPCSLNETCCLGFVTVSISLASIFTVTSRILSAIAKTATGRSICSFTPSTRGNVGCTISGLRTGSVTSVLPCALSFLATTIARTEPT